MALAATKDDVDVAVHEAKDSESVAFEPDVSEQKDAVDATQPKSASTSSSSALTLRQPSFMDHVHLPALFVVSLALAWFLGRFDYHPLWFLLSMVVFLYIYARRSAKFSKLVVFGLERDAARERLMEHTESVEWLNLMIGRFWAVYEPVLSANIIDSVNNILEINCPSFLVNEQTCYPYIHMSIDVSLL